MDEWHDGKREVSMDHPLSFEKADRNFVSIGLIGGCVCRMEPHFPKPTRRHSYRVGMAAPAVMQEVYSDIKHWVLTIPCRARANGRMPAITRNIASRHPRGGSPSCNTGKNARTSGGGNITMVPQKAITVGPQETWQAEKVIWHGAHTIIHCQRLTNLMIAKNIADSAVPMSLLGSSKCAVQLLPRRLGSCSWKTQRGPRSLLSRKPGLSAPCWTSKHPSEPDVARERLAQRGEDISKIDELLALDEKRRGIVTEVTILQADRNAASKEIGALMGQGKRKRRKPKKQRPVSRGRIDALEYAKE